MENNKKSQIKIVDIYIRMIILTILIVLSFNIIRPFLLMFVWAAILGIALYPFYKKVLGWFGGKKKGLVTSTFIIILLAVITVPSLNLTGSVIDSFTHITTEFKAGKIEIPIPNDKVKELPVIGDKIYKAWTEISVNLKLFIIEHKETVANLLETIFGKFKGLMGSVLLALISLIIAGAFMSSANGINTNAIKLGNKLIPKKGDELINMIVSTVRSVVKGILAVALIQSLLAYAGFAIAGLPGAAFFAFLVLIMAIIQLPPIIAMIPAIALYASVTDSNTALIIFTIYSIIVSMSDNFLKPVLLAKGLETPMLVILLGALGGMIFMGMIGLFVGPVILAVVFKLYLTWVEGKDITQETVG